MAEDRSVYRGGFGLLGAALSGADLAGASRAGGSRDGPAAADAGADAAGVPVPSTGMLSSSHTTGRQSESYMWPASSSRRCGSSSSLHPRRFSPHPPGRTRSNALLNEVAGWTRGRPRRVRSGGHGGPGHGGLVHAEVVDAEHAQQGHGHDRKYDEAGYQPRPCGPAPDDLRDQVDERDDYGWPADRGKHGVELLTLASPLPG
jgi:hypothetical protein